MRLSATLLDIILDIITKTLEEFQVKDSRHIAHSILGRLRKALGGRRHYFPVDGGRYSCQEVRRSFTGDNHHEVCQRFGISLSTLYRLLKNN